MSALGQKRILAHLRLMSALPPKAEFGTQPRNVCFVPKADVSSRSKTTVYSITSWRWPAETADWRDRAP